jgi:membrane protein DedA with SNARE-associated domain
MYGIMKWFTVRGKVPRFLDRAMKKWTSFLAVRDERIILVNRIAPAVPFTGAFIAVCGWNLRRSLAYVLIGGVVKYVLLLLLVVVLGLAFEPGFARLVTLVAVVVLVAASLAAGWYRGRKRAATS